jgi:hypothetical protein
VQREDDARSRRRHPGEGCEDEQPQDAGAREDTTVGVRDMRTTMSESSHEFLALFHDLQLEALHPLGEHL